MRSKSLFKSRLFWVNLLGGLAEVLQVAGDVQLLPQGTLTVALAIINVLLRLNTDEPVHVRKRGRRR